MGYIVGIGKAMPMDAMQAEKSYWYQTPQGNWWQLKDIRGSIMPGFVSAVVVGTARIVAIDKSKLVILEEGETPEKKGQNGSPTV